VWVQKYDALTKKVSTIIGSLSTCTTGTYQSSVLGTAGRLYNPAGLWGNTVSNILYIADFNNYMVRKYNLGSNILTTFAGNNTFACNRGDHLPATNAALAQPSDVWGDSLGNIFIADTYCGQVRKVLASGIMTTFAGTTSTGYNGDGQLATLTTFSSIQSIVGDSNGNIFVAENSNNYIVRMIYSVDGTTNLVLTIMGVQNNPGSNPAVSLGTATAIAPPTSVRIDTNGNIYFASADSPYHYIYKGFQVFVPTSQPSGQPTGQPSRQPITRPSSQPTRKPSSQPSSQPSRQPSQQPTSFPSRPSSQPTAVPSKGPSSHPSIRPSAQPVGHPTSQPSLMPSGQPSNQPSNRPSDRPTSSPTGRPSLQPSGQPSSRPTIRPTIIPSGQPSMQPSRCPSSQPSDVPSVIPSSVPSVKPSSSPSVLPSKQPTCNPTVQPTNNPSNQPSSMPSIQPSTLPSSWPTSQPSFRPSSQPSGYPTSQPSNLPSVQPTALPTVQPTGQPTIVPSKQPSSFPSSSPTSFPTVFPSGQPSKNPSAQPTTIPSRNPSSLPTAQPIAVPSSDPTVFPSGRPTRRPSQQPSSSPTNQPSGQPTAVPTRQPSVQPSSKPSRQPSGCPTMQPTNQPSKQPVSFPTSSPSRQPSSLPSTQPSAQPSSQPASVPTSRPSSLPSRQPTSQPSCRPTSQPTINKKHCFNQTYYSFTANDCLDCPTNSFNNMTGATFCICKDGYHSASNHSVVDPNILDCQSCLPGEFSGPGAETCSFCTTGSFSKNYGSKNCEFCPLNFYNAQEGQPACLACPSGRTTSFTGAISASQCVSPIPNFTMGFFALFMVMVIFSWYIVFGKFHRVSFERRTKTVEPNIEKCRQVLLCEEELHYKHLIGVQEKRNRRTKKFKFISFVLISFLLIIVSVVASIIFFIYQVFFTSLILWRGMKVDFKLSPILDLLAEALRGITQYLGFPVDVLFILALPFLYLFEALASINLNLSTVNITCSGSQAPIELLINCFILGFLIIVVRSDYQLLFNVLLNNVNQRYLLNNLEQQLDKGNLWFSRYFFLGLLFTGFIMINPFQVGLRYCMGFVRLDSFAKNHKVAHEVSQACDQVPGARYFDSFLGYTSTLFAWWLILPAVYCLAEVVVPKCKKTDPLKKINTGSQKILVKRASSVLPAELIIDENNSMNNEWSVKKSVKSVSDHDSDEEKGEESNSLRMSESVADEPITDVPNHISAKFPGLDEDILARVYQEVYKDRLKVEKEEKMMRQYSTNTMIISGKEQKPAPSYIQKSLKKVTRKMPFLPAFYYYCKEKYFSIISIDLWVSNTLVRWIEFLHSNSPKKVEKDEQKETKQAVSANNSVKLISAKQSSSVKRPGMKQLLSLDSTHFMQSMYFYDQAQEKKQKNLDLRWRKEQLQNNYTLPSYYELSHVVQEELHDIVIQPFCSVFAFLGIGHFFTPTGRYYWTIVFHNYKIFLLVCLGIWTDEAVEAYNLKETSARLSVDDRAFLTQKEQKKEGASTKLKKNGSLLSQPSRKFSAQFLGFNITQVAGNNTRVNNEHKQQNFREVLPAIISILICSRVILFQIVPSLVLFATISMTLASFPLFIFNEFLAESLPPLIVWGNVNREMSIERELKSFIPLNSETNQALSEDETIRVLMEDYSWRLSLRGIILFWNESRLLQFFHSSLALFFSFLLLVYSPELLIYLVVILALLVPFILSRSLVLLLYLGNSLDLKDTDFPIFLRPRKQKPSTGKVEPGEEEEQHVEEAVVVVADSSPVMEEEKNSVRSEKVPEVRLDEIPFFTESFAHLPEKSSNHKNDDENSDSLFSDGEAISSDGSIDLEADIENSWRLSSSDGTEEP
jgi:hypothetical protein